MMRTNMRSLLRNAFMVTATAVLATSLTVALPRDAQSLSIVLDFTPNVTDIFGVGTSTFDPTPYGFTGLNQAQVEQTILSAVITDYLGYPTVGADPSSPLPNGLELDIDFENGNIGVAPTNGDPEFYYMAIGESTTSETFFGQACVGCVRDAVGVGPTSVVNGDVVGSILTDNIASLAGLASTDAELINLLAGTISHEIGHTLSLVHPAGTEANPGASAYGIMATGASPTNMPNSERILDRAFSYDNFDNLIASVGTRDAQAVPEPGTVMLLGIGLLVLVAVGRRLQVAR